MENKLAPRISICYRAAPGKYTFEATAAQRRPPEWLVKVQCKGPERDCEVSSESLVEYANCSDKVEEVQGFIQKFGPPFVFTRKDADCVYADTLGRWKSQRLHFCEIWDRMMGVEVENEFTKKIGGDFPQLWKAQLPWKAVEAKGVFRLANTGPIFVAETLYMGMVAKLLMVANTGKLRRCLNPDCSGTRYFIADHGKTQYCSEECGKWGQRKSKLNYWREKHGTKVSATLSKSKAERKPRSR